MLIGCVSIVVANFQNTGKQKLKRKICCMMEDRHAQDVVVKTYIQVVGEIGSVQNVGYFSRRKGNFLMSKSTPKGYIEIDHDEWYDLWVEAKHKQHSSDDNKRVIIKKEKKNVRE